jgi:hypothetical protein
MRELGVAFLALTVVYGLLVGHFSADEAGLAIAGGALGALWTAALSRTAEIRFRCEGKAGAGLFFALVHVPRAAISLVSVVFRAGLQRPRGRFVDQPLHQGRARGRGAATRRAMALLAVSLAPDQFALLHDGDRLRLHCIGMRGDERG